MAVKKKKKSVRKKRSPARKKTARKKVARKKTIKKTIPKRKYKKRGVKKVARKKARKRTYRRKRRRSNPGNPGSKKFKAQDVLMQVGIGAIGAIGGSMIAKQIPIKDPKIKAVLPLGLAVGLSFTPFAKGKMMQSAIIGLGVVGSLSLIKQFAPKLAVLAGDDQEYLEDVDIDLLGYNDDLDDLEDLEGQEDIEDDIEDLTGVSEEISGISEDLEGDEWFSPADI